jgi:hypothetical protein
MSAETEEQALLAALVDPDELEAIHPRDAGLAAAVNREAGFRSAARDRAAQRVAVLRAALKAQGRSSTGCIGR